MSVYQGLVNYNLILFTQNPDAMRKVYVQIMFLLSEFLEKEKEEEELRLKIHEFIQKDIYYNFIFERKFNIFLEPVRLIFTQKRNEFLLQDQDQKSMDEVRFNLEKLAARMVYNRDFQKKLKESLKSEDSLEVIQKSLKDFNTKNNIYKQIEFHKILLGFSDLAEMLKNQYQSTNDTKSLIELETIFDKITKTFIPKK